MARTIALLFALVCVSAQAKAAEVRVVLAEGGRARHVIVASNATGATGQLAARELADYLERLSGASFRVAARGAGSRVIALDVSPMSSPDGYTISVRGDSLKLVGSTPRAVLFATYDLLERLGCRWFAPKLAVYAGKAEFVPSPSRTLTYRATGAVTERPVFATRKLNVEEGLSHDSASLRAIVEWMPKARFNTISVPMDYGGSGRVRWDNWRANLTESLTLRGIDIEVGGHGYQNFLNASMQGGRLFDEHPEWFGRDSTCRRSKATANVFNADDSDAVSFVTSEAVRYMRERPEINILELWPPDGARWSACASDRSESASDRQARLLNTVSAALRGVRPDARLQSIAYNEAKDPPSRVMLDPRIIIDVCPIGQNFDFQIDDPRGANNAQYAALIRDWRARFTGHLALYSYYRRYAWLSLPMILPHYMQHDLRWYASIPLQGISSYAEPADWYTYELNHYVLGKLAWNPDIDVNAITTDYMQRRYGRNAALAATAYVAMEELVRRFGSIQYATPKTAAEIVAARARLDGIRAGLDRARHARDSAELERLSLMLEYASRDFAIQELRTSGQVDAARSRIEQLVTFVSAHAEKGVFLLTRNNDRARIFRHYGMRADP